MVYYLYKVKDYISDMLFVTIDLHLDILHKYVIKIF